MYYTNKGVQALVDLDYDKAYTYFKEAIKKTLLLVIAGEI